MKIIDLHAHSTASDGSYSPTELAEHAKEIGLSAIALTDHDTVDGLEEFMQAGKDLQLETIRGMETTVSVDDCDVHLVCLFFDPDYPALKTALQDLAASRDERNVNMVKACLLYTSQKEKRAFDKSPFFQCVFIFDRSKP